MVRSEPGKGGLQNSVSASHSFPFPSPPPPTCAGCAWWTDVNSGTDNDKITPNSNYTCHLATTGNHWIISSLPAPTPADCWGTLILTHPGSVPFYGIRMTFNIAWCVGTLSYCTLWWKAWRMMRCFALHRGYIVKAPKETNWWLFTTKAPYSYIT